MSPITQVIWHTSPTHSLTDACDSWYAPHILHRRTILSCKTALHKAQNVPPGMGGAVCQTSARWDIPRVRDIPGTCPKPRMVSLPPRACAVRARSALAYAPGIWRSQDPIPHRRMEACNMCTASEVTRQQTCPAGLLDVQSRSVVVQDI